MCRLESAWLVFSRAGERSALISKELSFQQIGRQRGAVDLYECSSRAFRVRMNKKRERVFTSSGLAGDQYIRVRFGNPFRETNRLAHCLGTGHNFDHD
jgi:hypothetical protein